MDGAKPTTTRTLPDPAARPRQRGPGHGVVPHRRRPLQPGLRPAVPGFAGHGAVLAISLAASLAVAAAGIWCLRAPVRVPVWVMAAAPVVATLVLGALNLITRDSSTGSQLFFLWAVVFAASFLDLRRNILVLSTVVAAEAIVMGVLQTPSGPSSTRVRSRWPSR